MSIEIESLIKNEEQEFNEIEEMAKLLFDKYSDKLCQDCGSQTSCEELGYDDCGICSSIARDLQDEGYGNVKQAVKEFVEDLKEIMYDLMFPISENKNGFCNYNGAGRVVVDVENLIKEIDAYLSEVYGED